MPLANFCSVYLGVFVTLTAVASPFCELLEGLCCVSDTQEVSITFVWTGMQVAFGPSRQNGTEGGWGACSRWALWPQVGAGVGFQEELTKAG